MNSYSNQFLKIDKYLINFYLIPPQQYHKPNVKRRKIWRLKLDKKCLKKSAPKALEISQNKRFIFFKYSSYAHIFLFVELTVLPLHVVPCLHWRIWSVHHSPRFLMRGMHFYNRVLQYWSTRQSEDVAKAPP